MSPTFLFWFFLIVLFYTYVGYALLVGLVVKLKQLLGRLDEPGRGEFEPEVCLFVTAFNEREWIQQKVENSLALDYPKDKIQYIWVTDGSDDGSPVLLESYPEIEVFHLPERRGKVHAMNRGMQFVRCPIVVFSDANTLLGKQTIREIVRCFQNPKVGCVAGEKRIIQSSEENAASAGEGLYWKFESWVKRNDSELNTAVGAVGELFAIRTDLFEPVEDDTLLDDFIISMRIAQKGYKIAYSPDAYACEKASLNVKEELKRKIRIAAGGVQTIFRLRELLDLRKYGCLSWQYFSHKVLRWTLAPMSLFLLFVVNGVIVLQSLPFTPANFYHLFFALQLLGYLLAVVGWYLENKKLRYKFLFVPYYFLMINYAAVAGMIRYLKGRQNVAWEKAKRAV